MLDNMKINLHFRLITSDKKVRLRAKLTAYTKGIIPDVSKYIIEAPDDDKFYGRKNGAWESISDAINEWYGTEEDLWNEEVVEGVKYITIQNTPEWIIQGGTAYSDENEEYSNNIKVGNAFTQNINIESIPMNAKGEFINGTETDQIKV